MTQENVMENIKAGLDEADPATLQSIWAMLNRAPNEPAAFSENLRSANLRSAIKRQSANKPVTFVGENLSLEDYEKLSIAERCEQKKRLKEQNQRWLQGTFSKLGAAWLVVVSGEIIAWGNNLNNLPLARQNVEVAKRTGKFPFVFVNDDFMAIEESHSAWNLTNEAGDYYPSIPIVLATDLGRLDCVGDFDTGAARSFADYDFLVSRQVILPELGDDYEISRHLSQLFNYVTKPMQFELYAASGQVRTLDGKIHCVLNWHLSPFIKINPNRVALIGRDLMLALKPRVLLDFEQRQTEILSSTSTRKKAGVQKKQVSRSRRRRLS